MAHIYSQLKSRLPLSLLCSPVGAPEACYQSTHSTQQLVGDLLPRDFYVSMNRIQPAGSVYTVSALAIAIVVTVELETAAALQTSLLLRCGDIELNPGPVLGKFHLSMHAKKASFLFSLIV